MPDFMNPSADLQAGIAAGWAEGQRQIEDMQDEIDRLESECTELRIRAQCLESTLVLVEDQRDAIIAERDAAVARIGVLRTELHYERQQHASTREMLRAKERGNT